MNEALKKIKEQENNPDDHVANDENSPSRSAQPIEDISFTAKERVTKAREEQQRRDAEIYLRKGTFELMVDQMQHDLAPFLLLIPPPVKAYVKNTSIKLAKQGKSMLTGALFPMAMTGIKVARAGVELVNSLNNIVDMTTQKTRLLLDRVEENYVKAHEEKQNAGKRTHEGDDGVEYGVEVAGEVVGDHDEHDNSHISVDRSDMSAEQEDGGEVIDL
ncbi:hypothetical protein EON65_31795 [archaeon]|nr:MAG: hypothetical protein EON65_31795 [archaeon]